LGPANKSKPASAAKGAKAAAAGFGLPYVHITCSANTEIGDLLGAFLPDTKTNAGKNAAAAAKYPTFEDIRMDPSTAYHTMTGEYIEDISEEEVYAKLIENIQSGAAVQNNTGQVFNYIETPLVNAIRRGWLCEVQEPSIIANPGVLVGLTR
jgi:MoxR-like ATPase